MAAPVIPPDTEAAVRLMCEALRLLDAAGDTLAAARLQHAIDTALRVPAPEPRLWGDESELLH